MKHLAIAGIFAIASSAAIAEPFDYQKQWGGPELNPYHGTENLSFAPVVERAGRSSLTAWMLGANVDGVALNEFEGRIVKSGPTRISLYEFVRDSPEGIAYRDYHERFPADTDWDAVAREYRERQDRGIAAAPQLRDGES